MSVGVNFGIHAAPDYTLPEVAHLTSELLAGSMARIVKGAFGSGEIVIPMDDPLAQFLTDDALVKVYGDLSATEAIHMFTLEDTGAKVLSEGEDARVLRWRGPGALALTQRGMLLESWYAPGQTARGSGGIAEPGMWRWTGEPWGAIALRAVEEGIHQPGTPLAFFSPSFDRFQDSNGVPWADPTIVDLFETRTFTTTLEVLLECAKSGITFYVVDNGGPTGGTLRLGARQTFGTDRSGAAYGAGVVRFQAGGDSNIYAELERQRRSRQRRTHLVVAGEGTHVIVANPSATVAGYDSINYPSDDNDVLQAVGEEIVNRRTLDSFSARFPTRTGNDPASGLYRLAPPWVAAGGHAWVGDTVTVDTSTAIAIYGGASEHDIVEFDTPLAAIEFMLTRDHGWDQLVEVGSVYDRANQRDFDETVRTIIRSSTGHRHPPNPRLCEHEIGPNLLLGLAAGSIKVSSEDAANQREEACDGDVGTVWDGVDGVGVPDEYWAADLGSSKAASVFRLITDTPAHSTNFAPSLALYGSNDPAAWTWLPAGKIAADPTANGWTLVSGYSGQTFPVDTGNVPFATQAFRYWMLRATSGATGGTTDWDINEVTLADIDPTIGESPRASRCDHNHYAENLLTTETSTDKRLAPDGSGGVQWVAMAEGMVGWFIRSNYATANDMIAAYNANGGGVLYWPAGEYSESVGLDPITAGGLILGDGHAHRDGTTQAVSRINLSSTTDSLFTIAAHAVTLRGLALVQNGSTPSAGAGITVTSGGHARYENLSVSGFFRGINIQDGEHWEARGCYIYNTVSHGWQIAHTDLPDGGDWSILGGWVTAAARTAAGANAINYISGGGGKIMGVKINADAGTRYTDGIALNIPNGVTTVDLQIVANNIENVSRHAITLTTTGSGIFRHVVIAANHTGFWAGTNNTGKAVNIVAASAGSIKDITIGPNTFYGGGGTARSAIQLTNVDNVTLIRSNLSGAFTSQYTATTSTNIDELATVSAAEDVSIIDAGGYFVGTDVEAALQELGAVAGSPNVHDEPLTDGASNFIFASGDIVVVVGVPN